MKVSIWGATKSSTERPCATDPAMILSSTSVRFIHLSHFVAKQFERPAQNVLEDESPKIADVSRGVDSWAASVDTDVARRSGLEDFEAAT